MYNLRKKGKRPASHDSSPGAQAIQQPCASQETGRTDEVVRLAAGTESNIASALNRQSLVSGSRAFDTAEPIVLAVEVDHMTAEEPRTWHDGPYFRAFVVVSCLLGLLIVLGFVVLVLFLTKTIGGSSPATTPVTLNPTASVPTPDLTPVPSPLGTLEPTSVSISNVSPEQRACNFIGHSFLSDCRTTLRFDSVNGTDETIGITIPSEIGLLTQLTHLSLGGRQLTGTIPSSISQLSLLTLLSFYNNKLTGPIPSSISQLTLLNTLYFDSNHLTGQIPSSISKLTRLIFLAFDYSS